MGWCQNVHFDCPPLPPLTAPARTVYELRPQDIKVVMALGDSVTAGKRCYGNNIDIEVRLVVFCLYRIWYDGFPWK